MNLLDQERGRFPSLEGEYIANHPYLRLRLFALGRNSVLLPRAHPHSHPSGPLGDQRSLLLLLLPGGEYSRQSVPASARECPSAPAHPALYLPRVRAAHTPRITVACFPLLTLLVTIDLPSRVTYFSCNNCSHVSCSFVRINVSSTTPCLNFTTVPEIVGLPG